MKSETKLAHIIDTPKKRKPPIHRLTAEKLLALKTANPNLTMKQLGKLNDVGHTAIVEAFKRYGIKSEHLEGYKTNRADIFAGLQEIVAASLTEDDIKGANLRDRTILLGTLYDKERLERGQSTSNQSVFFQIVQEANNDD
jgi:exopolyphosphatase/pppGpp-phosphohydrolase